MLAIDPLQLHLISEPESCVSVGLLIVSFNVCGFLFLKLNRGPYREARRAAGCNHGSKAVHTNRFKHRKLSGCPPPPQKFRSPCAFSSAFEATLSFVHRALAVGIGGQAVWHSPPGGPRHSRPSVTQGATGTRTVGRPAYRTVATRRGQLQC